MESSTNANERRETKAFEMLDKMDANGDDEISAAEMQSARRR